MYRYRQQIYNFYMYRVETVWGAMWYRPRDSLYRAVGSGHSESGSGYVLVRFVYVKTYLVAARATPGSRV